MASKYIQQQSDLSIAFIKSLLAISCPTLWVASFKHAAAGSIIICMFVARGMFYPLTDPFICAALISGNTSPSDLTGH